MIKYLFFGLYDVLIKGKLGKKPDTSYFSELIDFAKEKKIALFLITGVDKDLSKELIAQNGIDVYFTKKNIIDVTDSYYDSLDGIDKELKKQAKEKDSNYSDEYFKVYYFNKIFSKSKEKTLFVGHDIWTDAYYLHKYSQINTILLKDTLSNNHAPNLSEIKDLNIINPSFEEFKDYLINKKEFKYSSLNSYANKLLYSEMFGKSLFNSNLSVGKILDKSHSKVVLKKKEEEWLTNVN